MPSLEAAEYAVATTVEGWWAEASNTVKDEADPVATLKDLRCRALHCLLHDAPAAELTTETVPGAFE